MFHRVAVVAACVVFTACGGSPGSGEAFIAGQRDLVASAVDLTSEGSLDWAQWGAAVVTDFNHKAGVLQQISDYTRLGNEQRTTLLNAGLAGSFSWTDGTPTTAASAVRGVFVDTNYLSGDGFRITVAADRIPKRLRLYTGNWCVRARVAASLEGDDTVPYVDTTFEITDPHSERAVFVVDFRAASPNQTLVVEATVDENHCTTGDQGELWLLAATLAHGG